MKLSNNTVLIFTMNLYVKILSMLNSPCHYMTKSESKLKLHPHLNISHLFFKIIRDSIKRLNILMKFKDLNRNLLNINCTLLYKVSKMQLFIHNKKSPTGQNWTNNWVKESNCQEVKCCQILSLKWERRRKRKEKRKTDNICSLFKFIRTNFKFISFLLVFIF